MSDFHFSESDYLSIRNSRFGPSRAFLGLPTMERQVFEEHFSAHIACRLHLDARSTYGPRTVATVELILICGVIACHQSAKTRDNSSERCSMPALRGSLRKFSTATEVYQRTVWLFLRKQLKNATVWPPDRKTTFRCQRVKPDCFC